MAYVNMTLDGQTKRTDSIKLVGADGVSKDAILTAVLEASDGATGGVSTGQFVGDGTTRISVKADSSNLIVRVKGDLSTALVSGTRTMGLITIDKINSVITSIASNGNGTSMSSVYTNGTAGPFTISADGTITINNMINGGGTFTSGITYEWFKW